MTCDSDSTVRQSDFPSANTLRLQSAERQYDTNAAPTQSGDRTAMTSSDKELPATQLLTQMRVGTTSVNVASSMDLREGDTLTIEDAADMYYVLCIMQYVLCIPINKTSPLE